MILNHALNNPTYLLAPRFRYFGSYSYNTGVNSNRLGSNMITVEWDKKSVYVVFLSLRAVCLLFFRLQCDRTGMATCHCKSSQISNAVRGMWRNTRLRSTLIEISMFKLKFLGPVTMKVIPYTCFLGDIYKQLQVPTGILKNGNSFTAP